jgi:hypothetical protein
MTPDPAPLAPPPPTAIRLKRHGCYTGREDVVGGTPGDCTTTMTWKEAVTDGTEIRVYGVTGCLSATESAIERTGGGSCLIEGTAVPASMRVLIAKAPAADGGVSWTRPALAGVIPVETGGRAFDAIGVDRLGDDVFSAIVVAAYNSTGHSKFIIADAGTWCYGPGCGP